MFARTSSLWPVLAVAALLAAAFAYHAFHFADTDWEKVYVPAAARYEEGDDVFGHADEYVYPPFSAVLALPSAHSGPFAVRVHVWLMNVAGGTALVVCGWWLTGGRFGLRQPPREWWIALIGLPAFLGFFFETLVNRETDLVIGGLAVAGCWQVVRGRDWLGGAMIGVAAAMKCTPLLFAPYFAFVGRWKAGAAVALAAVVANLAPDLVVPPPHGQPRLTEWVGRFLLPITRPDQNPGRWHAAEWSNHSLAGIVNRLSSYRLLPSEGGIASEPVASPPPPVALKVMVYGGGLALLAVSAFVVWRRGRRAEGFGIGAVLCLMLLLSPMSSKPHFCVLAVPAWAVARAGLIRRKWSLVTLVMLAGLLELTSAKDLVRERINTPAMWYGAIPAGVLLLLAGCLWVKWTAPPTTTPSPS